MKIKFVDVGRDKWCGIIEKPDTDNPETIAEYAYKEALKHLATRYPDTIYDSDKNYGRIESGYHLAGTFSVVKENGKNET